MPASDGASFVGAMDKMLCGLERDLQVSAVELEGIRAGIVKDLQAIGQDGLGNIGTMIPAPDRLAEPGQHSPAAQDRE